MNILKIKIVKGQSIIELIGGLIIIIPIVILLLDLAIIVMAVQTNENIAKNAARVASQSDPLSAQAKAQALVNQASFTLGSFIKSIKMTNYSTNLTSTDIQNWINNGGIVVHSNGSIDIPGQVSITTTIKVQGFIIPLFLSSGQPINFKSTHQYPFSFASYDPTATANPWTIPASGASYMYNQ